MPCHCSCKNPALGLYMYIIRYIKLRFSENLGYLSTVGKLVSYRNKDMQDFLYQQLTVHLLCAYQPLWLPWLILGCLVNAHVAGSLTEHEVREEIRSSSKP